MESLDKLSNLYNRSKDLKANNIIPNPNIDYNKLNQEGIYWLCDKSNK